MESRSKSLLALAAGIGVGAPVFAADMSVKLTLPAIESHGGRPALRPYVAVWIRNADGSFASNLAVWYQTEAKARRGGPGLGGEAGMGSRGGMGGRGEAPAGNTNTPGGARWMNEVRQWWADSGNTLKFPVDGLTSASRAAGTHELSFDAADPKLAALKPGKYQLMVEAAREHGGDETLAIPFSWPVATPQSGRAGGRTELGPVELSLRP